MTKGDTISAFFTGLLSTATLAVEKEGDDPLQWLRDSIPGEPGVDYPIFSEVGETNFDCNDKVFGGKQCKEQLICSLYETPLMLNILCHIMCYGPYL